MTETMPAWLGIPLATVLWGYLALDAIVRRKNRLSAHFDAALSDWRECRDEFERTLEAAYERAAAATNDRLLNARGHRAGIDPITLFMGNEARARAYASPELLEHWERHPRMTFAAFEAQWMRDRPTYV